MSKKTVKEISSILKEDIKANIKLIGSELSPLIIASAYAVSARFKIGPAILNNPREAYKINPSVVRALITQLYKNRKDYADILDMMNTNHTNELRVKNIKGDVDSPLITGILARVIGYDLFMLTVLSGMYPSQVTDIDKIWIDATNGSIEKCKLAIKNYIKSTSTEGSLHGSKSKPNFNIPDFCKK